ncbi:hypothetical protein Tco_0921032 [Tanacetum coccineum]
MAIRKSHRSWALFTVKNKSVIVLGFDYGNNRRFFFHAPLNTLLNKVNDRITYGKLEDNSLFNMSGKWIPSEMSRIEGKNSRTGDVEWPGQATLFSCSKAAMHAGIDKLAAMQAGIDILQIRQRRNQKQKTVNDLRTEVVDAVLIPFDATGLKKVFGDGVMKREETCSPLYGLFTSDGPVLPPLVRRCPVAVDSIMNNDAAFYNHPCRN